MKLTDKIELWTAEEFEERGEIVLGPFEFDKTIKANVSYQSVNRSTIPGQDLFVERMNCIIEPMDFDPRTMRLKWQGTLYTNDGPPKIRMMRGKVHHLTIQLQAA